VFGQILEQLLIADSDGLPLDYTLNGSEITVDSLGADQISITYLTQDLTSKDGKYWTLTIDAPISTQIVTAEQTTIISLNKVPEMIQTSDNQVTLVMEAGLTEVTYVIGVIGTQTYAQMVIQDAQQTIDAIKDLGIIVTEAELKLAQAQGAYNQSNYAEAETLGNEAKTAAIQTNQTAAQAQQKIVEAQQAILQAEDEQRTFGLNDAQNLLSQANAAYSSGGYSQALALANQALTATVNADVLSENFDPLIYYVLLIAILAVIAVFIVFFVRSKNKTEQVAVRKERRIDVERIFRVHKNLLPEERQAIEFLVQNNGEAFEADLYEYVKLPRTTTWRMVKRLQDMGIIKTTKFRRQNLVRIKRKFDIKH
jgi:uncharacterized membrane protein